MTLKRIATMTLVFFLASCILVACGPKNVRVPVVGNLTSEQIARGVYEKLTAFLREAQANHPECSADQPTAKQGICPALQDAIAAQNRLATAINLYCSGTPLPGDAHYTAGGSCSPVLGTEPTLEGIMAEALNILSLLRPQLQSQMKVRIHESAAY